MYWGTKGLTNILLQEMDLRELQQFEKVMKDFLWPTQETLTHAALHCCSLES